MIIRRVFSSLAVLAVFLTAFALPSLAAETGYIDNSSIVTKYVTDDKVQLVPINGGALLSPDWVKSLIIEEMNVAKVSPNGRFSGMNYALDHLAEMGVNGVWLTPIYDGKHYLNYGPATVSPYLTGCQNYDEGWKVVADFVKEAHKRNIRVFFDIVTWGANEASDIYVNNPDWFSGYSESYKGPLYNWKNEELMTWFSNEMIDIIRKTNADGFRADCGISYCGPELYKRVRKTLYDEKKYIILIGETINDKTADLFDFNEHSQDYEISTEGNKFIDGSLNMVSVTTRGFGIDTKARQLAGTAGNLTYYTSIVSCHDTQNYVANGSYVPMAYASILSPYIPLWYAGEEWINPYNSTGWLWACKIDWSKVDDNRSYYENIKAYIRIRRMYPEIFEYFPDKLRDTNICNVKTNHSNALQAYARYAGGKGILVIPNSDQLSSDFTVTIPYSDMGLDKSNTYQVVNLLSGKKVAVGNPETLIGFNTNIAKGNVGVYLVAPSSEKVTIPKPTSSATTREISSVSSETPTESAPSKVESNTESSNSDKISVPQKSDTLKETQNNFPVIGWVITGVVVLCGAVTVTVIIIRKRNASA